MNEENLDENSGPKKRGPQRSREQIEGLVAEYEKSGLTLKEFAARAGFKLGSMRGWVYHTRRRRRQKGGKPRAAVGFAAVEVRGSVASKATIHWPSGMAFELTMEEAGLVRVLRELTTPCSP
jgi:hypothetical protein